MKKLLLSALLAGASMSVFAGDIYYWTFQTDDDPAPVPVSGALRRVSENGRWAAGGDYDDLTGSFIIDTHNPSELIRVNGGEIYDVADNGLTVGVAYKYDGSTVYSYAAVYSDGAWKMLEANEEMVGQSMATAITADGRKIAGHAWCYDVVNDPNAGDSDPKGRYYPVTWTLGADGKYHVETLYTNLSLPYNQGFYVYDMTPDGSTLCGLLCTEAGGFVAAMIRDGELVYWHEFETRMVESYWNGQYLGEFETYFVDGAMEGCEGLYMNGRFAYADNDFLYGSRTVLTDVSEDGEVATYNYLGAIYDLNTDEWKNCEEYTTVTCGFDNNKYFDTMGRYCFNGQSMPLNEAFNVTGRNVAGVYDFDSTGRVFACTSLFFNDAIGEFVESPVLVILEDSLAGVSGVVSGSKPVVKVDGRTISVYGAAGVSIYNLEGKLVGKNGAATVAPGVYVVVADGIASKVVVR